MCTPRGAWILTGCGLEAPGAGPGGGQGRGPYNFEQKRRKRGKIKLFAKVKYFAWKANPFSTDWSQRSCYTHTHAHTHTHTHTHIHTPVHAHTHTHTHAQSVLCPSTSEAPSLQTTCT